MIFKSSMSIISALILSIYVNSASASIINLQANMDGVQANSGMGTNSTGTGFAAVTFDDISNLLSWNISWSGLTGNETGMHFHGPALPSENGPVQVGFGAISGMTSPSIGSTTITDLQSNDLLAGLWYVNIHTDAFGVDEIRGQVEVVPVPAAVWLFGSGLIGLVGFARRKKA